MPCKLCGNVCRCSSDGDHADGDYPSGATFAAEGAETAAQEPELIAKAGLLSGTSEIAPEDSGAWRRELSVRLNRYQSRRKPKPPRYPSLRLSFEQEEYVQPAAAPQDDFTVQIAPIVANQALALNHFDQDFPGFDSAPSALNSEAQIPAWSVSSSTVPAPAGKLLEFPRSWTPAAPPLDELAEPVMTRPRILEAPEIVPPPPALGGITIEPAHRPESEKRPGIDVPLLSAPLGHRIFAAVIDSLIIAAACAIFGCIFWKMTAIPPPKIQVVGFLAGLAVVFWAAYQYLLVVYAGTTPGLRLMHLELSRFDGRSMSRRLRRWRVLASFLSAISLGMGYGWVFLDEDSLCWHDRITHSYLAPAEQKKIADSPLDP